MENLTKKQQEIVEYFDSNVLVSAAAGSGKTRTLVSKFQYLIKKTGVAPNQILCVTFTNKASLEIINRLMPKLNLSKQDFEWVKTFHGACLKIIRSNTSILGLPEKFSIFDSNDQKKVLYKITKELNIDKSYIKEYKSMISNIKQLNPINLDIEKYITNNYLGTVPTPYKIYKLYENKLKEQFALDFDDILLKCFMLLYENPKILEFYKNKFKYIMIDEYQDINELQNELVNILKTSKNLFCIGDDYQCWSENCKIRTAKNVVTVKDSKVGDLVPTIKNNKYQLSKITNKSCVIEKDVYEIKTKSGLKTIVSDDHKWFVSYPNFNIGFYLCLMYITNKGFKIGITSMEDPYSFDSMIFLENPERLWVLQKYDTEKEANIQASILSLKYQIPNFKLCNDKIMKSFGQKGWKIFDEKHLFFDYPNYISQHNNCINLVMNYNDGFHILYNSPNKIDARISNTYLEARREAYNMMSMYNTPLIYEKLKLGDDYLNVIPTFQLINGMKVPIIIENDIKYDEIVSVKKLLKKQKCYHIEVGDTGILIADDIITHNSIYKWRGSDPKYFIDFEKYNNPAKIFKLEQNFRSVSNIIELGNDIIKNNKNQIFKNSYGVRGEGFKITSASCPNPDSEANFVTEGIKFYKTELNIDYNEIAVLYRTTFLTRGIEKYFINKKIPYKVVKGREFLDRREIKDLLSYIYFVYNLQNKEAFERSLTSPLRGIGDKSFEKIYNYRCSNILEQLKFHANGINKKNKLLIYNYISLIEELQKTKLENMIEVIMLRTKYQNYLESYSQDEFEITDRLENINELKLLSKNFSNIDEFIEHLSLNYTNDNDNGDMVDSVKLMTMHSSKGCEYKVIFIIGCEDSFLPHYKNKCIEEERRLFYVACTRAKDYLNISWCKDRPCMKSGKSRFLVELGASDVIKEHIYNN